MQDVFDYIDQHAGEYVARLQRLCRQPSIAAQGTGMEKTAQMVQEMLTALGAETRRVETAGYPVIYGEVPGHGARSLMIYNHYDVQPPEPLDLWEHDPFGADIIELRPKSYEMTPFVIARATQGDSSTRWRHGSRFVSRMCWPSSPASRPITSARVRCTLPAPRIVSTWRARATAPRRSSTSPTLARSGSSSPGPR